MMTRSAWVGLGLGIALLIGALVYFNLDRSPPAVPALETQTPPDPDAAVPEAEVPAPVPEVLHPVPESGTSQNLPPLEGSDPSLIEALQQAVGKSRLDILLVPREVVRRLVLNIDSLDREPAPLWLRSVPRVGGRFMTRDGAEALSVHPDNRRRYATLMAAVEALDAKAVARVYLLYYPLFQQAWMGIRTEGPAQFNDRLVEIIDHLLKTPQVEEPVQLVRPKVIYLFADPDLEERSSGQKALLRLGGDNAEIVKKQLRAIREVIASEAG